MAYNKYDVEITEEQFSSFLVDAVKRVETEADPDELAKLKKIFKKTVPFGRRSYVAAYLTKMLLSTTGSRSRFAKKSERTFSKETRDTSHFEKTARFSAERSDRHSTVKPEKVERAPRVQIDESLATTIFVGIGRNRRVYPRDLVGLLVSVANISRDRIGDIRVLANYSFIQLFTEDCEKALTALNGYEYRGRKLNVSYSKLNNVDEEADENENAATESEPLNTSESSSSNSEVTENTVTDTETAATPEAVAGSSYLV
ncbi:MAG: DbpA RNA binding domain-containing protein [Treponema sp.]|nr:DbpA RNA binding domain-containing protein [Treponema sp.]